MVLCYFRLSKFRSPHWERSLRPVDFLGSSPYDMYRRLRSPIGRPAWALTPVDRSLVDILCLTITELVRNDSRDLTARQLAVSLTCYLDPDSTNTVRGLARNSQVSRSR